jgi:hypothetical protein
MHLFHSVYGKVALLIATLALCGFSQPPGDKTPQSGASRTVSGTIGTMQRDTRQFVLKTSDGREYIIAIDGRTAVSTTGGNMNWFDLKPGMDATVTFVPSGNHFVAITVEASKGIPNPALGAAKQEPVAGAEPITVKGKVADLKSDLTQLTITTFDDKDITLSVDDDLRTRIKNGDPVLPKLDKGAEVAAVYVVKNGHNQLVSLRDLVVKEPAVAAAPSNPPVHDQSSRTTTVVNKPAMPARPNINTGLPLIALPLPAGFVATTNTPSGALAGQIVQVKQDMIILTSNGQGQQTGIAAVGAQTNTNQNAQNQSNQAVPNPTSQATQNPTNPIPQNPLAPGTGNAIANNPAGNFFVILGPNSKQPFVVDQRTKIVINNRGIRLGEITEGSRIQTTFELLGDGTRHVTMITATTGPSNTTNATRTTNPANPSPAQTGAQVQGQSTTTAAQANVFAGVVVSRKTDTLIVRDANGNELAFFMDVNSTEPLRVDDQTKVQINGQAAKITDLQVGMQANVFLEMANNMRRVIGITVGSSTTTPSTGSNTELTGGKK